MLWHVLLFWGAARGCCLSAGYRRPGLEESPTAKALGVCG